MLYMCIDVCVCVYATHICEITKLILIFIELAFLSLWLRREVIVSDNNRNNTLMDYDR